MQVLPLGLSQGNSKMLALFHGWDIPLSFLFSGLGIRAGPLSSTEYLVLSIPPSQVHGYSAAGEAWRRRDPAARKVAKADLELRCRTLWSDSNPTARLTTRFCMWIHFQLPGGWSSSWSKLLKS